MKNKKLRGLVHRITLATSDQYNTKERLLCLKETFESLSEMDSLSQEEISEIINKIQPILLNKYEKDD
ncbi:MAG: hypothetical protein KAX05_03420 [Bacteroidales bacterium]|nr:hypothetical protein [Bacteroidales bacterium]